MNGMLGITATRPGVEPDFDTIVVWLSIALLGLGLVMVYSASIAIAEAGSLSGGKAQYFLMRHALFVAVGICAAVCVLQIPMRAWQLAAPYIFVTGAVLLVLVLIPVIGK